MKAKNVKKSELKMVLIEEDALACMESIAERTGVTVSELVSVAARQYYMTGFDAPAPHVRWQIQTTRKEVVALN